MNLLQLVLKQMRQRALSSWLTILSVMLGVGLAVAVLIFAREGGKFFSQSDFGYDLIVGAKGSPLQLVLNTTYNLDKSPGNVPYAVYQQLARPNHRLVRSALPFGVGDEYKGHRVIGTLGHLLATDDLGNKFDTEDPGEIAKAVMRYPQGTRIQILAPRLKFPGTTYKRLLESLRTGGFLKFRIDGRFVTSTKDLQLDESRQYDVDAVVDEFPLGPDSRQRLVDSITIAQGTSKLPGASIGPVIILADRGAYWAEQSWPTEVYRYRLDRKLELAEGRPFHPEKFEAVIGSEVAEKEGIKIGSKFKAQHDLGAGDEHDEEWEVVGILKQTHTSTDRVLYIPLVSFYAIPAHEKGLDEMTRLEMQRQAAKEGLEPPVLDKPSEHHDEKKETTIHPTTAATTKAHHGEHDHEEAYELRPDGTISLRLGKDKWKVSSILVRTRGGFQNNTLQWQFGNLPDATAVSPARVMQDFFRTFLDPFSKLLFVVTVLVTVVAAVSICVSIYNSVSARLREIAILRALGATRARVLELFCAEAALIGFLGGVCGLLLGHLLGFATGELMYRLFGQEIAWAHTSWVEWVYLGATVVLAVLAGLLPAMKAYRTPVADNLVAA